MWSERANLLVHHQVESLRKVDFLSHAEKTANLQKHPKSAGRKNTSCCCVSEDCELLLRRPGRRRNSVRGLRPPDQLP
jgi:hypothetical protein